MIGWKFYLNNIEVEEPIGWDGIEFTAIRQELHGIDQPFSTTLQFYQKGAKILQSAFNQNFISAAVSLKITTDQKVNGQPFEYNGMIDFTTYEEINTCDTDSWSVSVGIIEDTFRDKFKARYDAEVDIIKSQDLDGNAINSGLNVEWRRYIYMHSQFVRLFGNARNYSTTNKIISKDGLNWGRDEFIMVLPVYWGDSDFNGIFGSTIDVIGLIYSNTNVIFQDNSQQNVQRQIQISWSDIPISVDFYYTTDNDIPPNQQSLSVALTIHVINSDGSDNALYYPRQVGNFSYQTIANATISSGTYSLQVPPNCRVAFYLQWGSQGTIQQGITGQGDSSKEYKARLYLLSDSMTFSLSERNRGFASYNVAFPIERILRRVIYQITGQNDKLLSNCFSEANDGAYANNSITNGLFLRQYVGDVALRTSFKKLIEGLAAIFGIGWAFEWTGTEWKIRVEPIEYFYQNEIVLTLNDVETLKKVPVADKLYGQLKLGFSDNWKNMALGGVDAIATDRVYFIDNGSVKIGETSTLELQSDIIAEGIAIEYSRRLAFFDDNSGSSDRPNDYNLFVIWTIREDIEIFLDSFRQYKFNDSETGYRTLLKYGTSWSADLKNGVTSRWGDILYRYNLFHTGSRVALRQWAFLGMNVYGMNNQIWRFQVGQYNTRFDSAVNANLQPYVIDKSTDLPLSLPLGTIRFAEDSDIGINVIREQYQTYILKPIIYEFKYPQSFCDFIQLANYTPYKKIRVTIGNTIVSGFILDIKNKPEDNSGGTTSFTLIASNIPDEPPIGERAYSSAYSNAYL